MDDKTVILRPQKTSDKETTPEKKAASPTVEPKSDLVKTGQKQTAKVGAAPQQGGISAGVIALTVVALLLIGLSTSLLTIYALGPRQEASSTADQQEPLANAGAAQTDDLAAAGDDISQADLDADFAPVSDADSLLMETEDMALIQSAQETGVIELSGDPVVVRQVQTRTRQLVALENETAKQAAASLGARGRVMRLTDMLDQAGASIDPGSVGSQEDVALLQNVAFAPENPVDPETAIEGASVLEIATSGKLTRQEYAKQIKEKTTLATELTGFGLDPEMAKDAEAEFTSFYGLKELRDKDAIAVVGAQLEEATDDALIPVQVSVYREGTWVGTIALSEAGTYVSGEDPWFEKDIFAAQLLPEDMPGGKPQRLLDAIYAVALRNGLPAAVAGETIMMMSRAHDLEQLVEKGDSIAILYSPVARDPKSGFGRVIYVRVTRATGKLECLVYQPEPGGQFQCISREGDASVAEAGIIMPVNGTVVAKFGPRQAKNGEAAGMNFGVDLAAPLGTPVVAAATGQVTAAGQEPNSGNVIRITHDDGGETSYSYLQRIAPGIKPGTKVTGGQTIGFVGNPPNSREPKLHFELKRDGEPADPLAEVQASIGQGSAVDVFVKRIIYIESGNRCDAKNPLSSATGLGQFINSTWMTTISIHRPDLLKLGRAKILALRTNCELSRAMTTAFTRDNASVIRSRGHPVTPGHLYLAHFLGVGGALKVLGSNPNQQIAAVFGEAHVRANPFERGKTIGHLKVWAAKKMAGKTPNKPLQPGKPAQPVAQPQTPENGQQTAKRAPGEGAPPTEKLQQFAADPQFAELKRNVDVLMR